jgi:hypothetical protein
MKLNRTHKRPLEFSRGPADRDPMFVAVWYDGAVSLVRPDPEPQPELPLELPPLAAPDPRELKWKLVVDRANDVTEALKLDPYFDGRTLVEVVCDLVDIEPSVDEIISAYRRRMEARRNG